MSTRLRLLGRFLSDLARAQHRDQLLIRAAALAYTTLVSIVPLLTVALATVARIQPERAEQVVQGIAAVLPFSPARVRLTLTAFAERTAALGWFAVVLSALVSFNAFYQIEEVINAIWGVPYRRKWRWRLASFAAVLVWGPLLITALFSFLYWMQSLPFPAPVLSFTRPLPAVFAFVVLAALYRWVPHVAVPWRAAFLGAAVASVVLIVIHLGFQAYLGVATNLNVIYGSLTIVLFFLVSLLLFWFAVLLGAEGSWVIGHKPLLPRELPSDAALDLLAEMARQGSVPAGRAATLLGRDAHRVLERLTAEPEIVAWTAGAWQLARNPADLTVAEVRRRLAPDHADTGSPSGEFRSLAEIVKDAPDGAERQPSAEGRGRSPAAGRIKD